MRNCWAGWYVAFPDLFSRLLLLPYERHLLHSQYIPIPYSRMMIHYAKNNTLLGMEEKLLKTIFL